MGLVEETVSVPGSPADVDVRRRFVDVIDSGEVRHGVDILVDVGFPDVDF